MFGIHVLTLATVAGVTQCLCHHYGVVHTTLRVNPNMCKYVIIDLFLEMEFRCINMKDHWTITIVIIILSFSLLLIILLSHIDSLKSVLALGLSTIVNKTFFCHSKTDDKLSSFKVSTEGLNYNNLHISYLHII